jgi:hypothetical protein
MEDGRDMPVHKGTTYKYLGIRLDTETSQAAGSALHIEVAEKTSRLMMVTLYKSGITALTIDMGRVIHLSHNQPRIAYGLGVVVRDSKRIPRNLVKYERQTMHILLGANSRCPTAVLYSVLGGKFLQGTIEAQQLAMVIRVLRLPYLHARRVALSAQAEVWLCDDIPSGTRKMLHMETFGKLLRSIDAALVWNDGQWEQGRPPAAAYSGGRTRQWFNAVMGMISFSGGSGGLSVVRTWEKEQEVVVQMLRDSKAALYITSVHQHREKLAALKSPPDVAWMSSQLVGTPFTSMRRTTTANTLRVQVRGGMWSFLPWDTYGALRTLGSRGCVFCDGCEAEGFGGIWTVTHLLRTCNHDELADRRKVMWNEVVEVASKSGLAGAYMLDHATDYTDVTMQSHMFALMVGEEVPNDFINLGLEGWKARKVARICQARGTGIGTSGGNSGAVPSEVLRQQLTSADASGVGAIARGSSGSATDHGVCNGSRGVKRDREASGPTDVKGVAVAGALAVAAASVNAKQTSRQTAVQLSMYQHLLNITGTALIYAQEYAVLAVKSYIDAHVPDA